MNDETSILSGTIREILFPNEFNEKIEPFSEDFAVCVNQEWHLQVANVLKCKPFEDHAFAFDDTDTENSVSFYKDYGLFVYRFCVALQRQLQTEIAPFDLFDFGLLCLDQWCHLRR